MNTLIEGFPERVLVVSATGQPIVHELSLPAQTTVGEYLAHRAASREVA